MNVLHPAEPSATRARATAALVLLLAACRAAPPEEPVVGHVDRPPADYQNAPWTDAFLEPANLIADEIAIEGPPALRAHLAVRQDSRGAAYVAKATPNGFLQELSARPDAGYVEMHATLDNWEIVAFRRLTWLERPADAPVIVRAVGAATWQGVDGGRERSDDLLEFRGYVR